MTAVTAAVGVYTVAGLILIVTTALTWESGLGEVIEIAGMNLLGVGLGAVMTRQMIQQGNFTILTFINDAGNGFMASVVPLIIIIIAIG